MQKHEKILISGAGVAGLSAGIWLARQGFQPVIVETTPSIRVGGFLVSLSHTAYAYMEELGVMAALQARGSGITGSSYHNEAGTNLLALDSRKLFEGVNVIQLMRDELVEALFEVARDLLEIRFEDSITAINELVDSVEVSFRNHADETYAVVIGADGLHSAVRDLAFPKANFVEHYLDLGCAAYRSNNVLGLENKFETHMQRTRYMATFTTGRGDIGNVFVWADRRRDVPPRGERPAILRNAFESAGGAIEKVLAACPAGEDIYMDALMQIEAQTWHTGRVVLVGDAAHCLTLFSGRGAGAAVNGGMRVAKALAELPVSEALERYERETRPVIDDIQPATRAAVGWYVPRNWFKQFVRDNAMRFLPNAVFVDYFHRKYTNI